LNSIDSSPPRKNLRRLDKALSAILILAILGAIGAIIYIVTNPAAGEKFTEFYILGLEGKAEGYPKGLTVGEEGKVILGITNREHKDMVYKVELRVEETLEKEIIPPEMEHRQNREEEVSFSPHEICANTSLIEEINPFYGPMLDGSQTIKVESVEHLKAGDFIWIGKELGQIDSINGKALTLKDSLDNHNSTGSAVTETQKVEFKLYKTHQIKENETKHTSLSLWLGREDLSVAITNQGQSKAMYEIEVEVKARMGNDEEVIEIESKGSAILSPGEKWDMEFSYIYPGANWQNAEFSLYRDGKLLYKEDALGGYPALHLWIEVR
jgi:uncharacterized membrane protein